MWYYYGSLFGFADCGRTGLRGNFLSIRELYDKAVRFLTPQNIVILLSVSAFAPFIFTAVFTVLALVYILFTPSMQRGLFAFKGAFLIPAFTCYAVAVAFFNRNILGVAVAVAFFAILVLYAFFANNITARTVETSFTAICVMVYPALLQAVVEVLTASKGSGVYRCTAYFANANYFGSLMAAATIICAYKILNGNGKVFYFATALAALINIYLSASLFAIVEVIVGVAVYLLISKHYRLFCLMVIVGSAGILLITNIPELLPRLYESGNATGYRVRIWGVAIREISSHPFFGRGFMTYNIIKDLYEGSYSTQHGHNIIIDSLLNFGIVGTLLLFVLIYYIVRRIVAVWFAEKDNKTVAVSVAFLAAIVAHAFTDITFFWLQTGLFYVMVLAAPACDEHRLGLDKDNYIKGKYRI